MALPYRMSTPPSHEPIAVSDVAFDPVSDGPGVIGGNDKPQGGLKLVDYEDD
jgi:hypothetical protein